MIATEVIRILGPVILRNVLNQGGGGGGAKGQKGSSDEGTSVTVGSPFDDDDDFGGSFGNDDAPSNGGPQVKVALPTFPPDEDDEQPNAEVSSTIKPSSENDV